MNDIASSTTATRLLIENETTRSAVLLNTDAVEILTSSAAAMAAIIKNATVLLNSDVLNSIVTKSVAINAVVNSGSAMDYILNNNSALTIFESDDDIMTAINNSEVAICKYIAKKCDVSTNNVKIVNDLKKYLDSINSDSTISDIFVNNEIIINNLVNDEYTLSRLSGYLTILASIADSTMAMTILCQNSTAMCAFGANNTTTQIFASNETAMNIIFSNDDAINAIINNPSYWATLFNYDVVANAIINNDPAILNKFDRKSNFSSRIGGSTIVMPIFANNNDTADIIINNCDNIGNSIFYYMSQRKDVLQNIYINSSFMNKIANNSYACNWLFNSNLCTTKTCTTSDYTFTATLHTNPIILVGIYASSVNTQYAAQWTLGNYIAGEGSTITDVPYNQSPVTYKRHIAALRANGTARNPNGYRGYTNNVYIKYIDLGE